MNGPGKYDDVCTSVREETQAKGVVLIVFGGVKGEGFSVQADGQTLVQIPHILRTVAQQIENDLLMMAMKE